MQKSPKVSALLHTLYVQSRPTSRADRVLRRGERKYATFPRQASVDAATTLTADVRPSRDGDQFHYTWAARQALRLLDPNTGPFALYVEGVDPSEHRLATERDIGESAKMEIDDRAEAAGDEVVDLAEYWGSSTDIDDADSIVYRQFKHSTNHPDKSWNFSYLDKTLVGFARKFRAHLQNHPQALTRVKFEFVTNRPASESALKTLGELQTGRKSASADSARLKLAGILSDKEILDFAQLLEVDLRAPALLSLRHLLETQVADLLPGAPGDQALLLKEMISSRATSVMGGQPAVYREDVLAALKTSDAQLLPAPNLIQPPVHAVVRHQFALIAELVHDARGTPVVIHGSGGVGKSVLSLALQSAGPTGSTTLLYDCFGNGSYRRPSGARHQAKQGLVQLSNELAARSLCDPLVPSASADDADYARAFLRRVQTASAAIAATASDAVLTIVVDAADNAAMMATDVGERAFVAGLLREALPSNVRLVVTCRTERRHLLDLPPNHLDVRLEGFDLAETEAHVNQVFADVSSADAGEFHARTSHNPRVQATVLDGTSTVQEALDWLAPNPPSAGAALDSIIERQIAEVRDSQHSNADDIDQVCFGLAALRPMIPVRVLAELSGIEESLVTSFVTDLGRPLLIDGGTVQFRDEPTETWFRDRYRPSGAALDQFLLRLTPLADRDAYVAASLPSLLFEAERFDDLVELALSDRALPDNSVPEEQRNELQRREISQQRTQFALSAALRRDDDFAGALLALRLGELTAGQTRRLKLIGDNTDLSARFLDPHVLEQLVATRAVSGDWPSSNLLYEGALLACSPGQTDQARNRLRSAVTWVRAWTQQAARTDSRSNVRDKDIAQIAWGLLNTDGPIASVEYLRRWRPRTLAFDVGLLVARRLADSGRSTEFESLALSARGRYAKFAIAQVCAERNMLMSQKVISHLLKPLLTRSAPVRPSRRSDESWACPVNELIHEGLTAVVWLLTQALAAKLVSKSDALRILNLYLPKDMGYRTGEWHQRDVWVPILGFALQAYLQGRVLDAVDIEGSAITKARERERVESSRSIRAYRENIDPLVSWANLWIALELSPSPDLLLKFSKDAQNFLERDLKNLHGDERIDQVHVNITTIVIASVYARHPEALDANNVVRFCESNGDIIWRSTLILVVQCTSASDELEVISSRIARQVHSLIVSAREDAHEKAKDLILLARATYQSSHHEAEIHFKTALEIANSIGDDAWSRFDTLIDIALLAGGSRGDERGRAYRLGQIAEGVEEYLGDSLDFAKVARAAAALSVPESLALISRWRDRRVAPISRLVEQFCSGRVRLMTDNPALAALLPLCDRPPAIDELAESLKSSPMATERTIIALLRLWRTKPPAQDNLDRALAILKIDRRAIEDVDPSLLLVQDNRYEEREASSPVGPIETLTYEGIDFTSIDGWGTALVLERELRGADREALFEHVGLLGYTAPVLEAFGNCPMVNVWHLESLIKSVQKTSLSMGAQGALDQALRVLLGRLGPDYLLVTYRSLGVERLREITGRTTDYGQLASRAVASHQSFNPEEAFALAANLTARVTFAERLSIFDASTKLFADTAPADSLDGSHPSGMTASCDDVTAIASVIWSALGDPAPATRWRAAHATHLLLTLGDQGLLERLCEIAMGEVDVAAFRDERLPFYDKHAMQWLVFALSRASLEPSSLPHISRFEPLLRELLKRPPHAVISPLVRDVVLRLREERVLDIDSQLAGIKSLGQPTEVIRRPWGSQRRVVNSFSEIDDLAGHLTDLIQPEANLEDVEEERDPCPSDGVEDDADAFNFFFDFRSYWCNQLGTAFGLTDGSVEKLVNEVLVHRWQVQTRGRVEDDPRHELRLYSRNSYSQKAEWPEEEDLDFYLAVHGLYEVAGALLQLLPVSKSYDDDDQTGSTDYLRFLAHHIPTRADGRWLSDRADPVPAWAAPATDSAVAVRSGARDLVWPYEINGDMFRAELAPEPDHLAVSAVRSIHDYGRNETVHITSALVNPRGARSLLRAMQTAPDIRAFRLPHASDHEFESTVEGFELTGWIEESGYAEGLDSKDPMGAGMAYPPQRPSESLRGIHQLRPDADMRLWRDRDGRVIFTSAVWDETDGGTNSHGSLGHRLLIERRGLSRLLRHHRRWLIVEVQIRRYIDSSRYRSLGSDDDERPQYLEPSAKYFLVDDAGEIYDYQ